MKNILTKCLLVVALAIVAMGTTASISQSSAYKDVIVGEWDYYYEDEDGEDYEYFEFKSDGTYYAYWWEDDYYYGEEDEYEWTGRWSISGNKLTLMNWYDDGDSIEFTIDKLTDDEMILITPKGYKWRYDRYESS